MDLALAPHLVDEPLHAALEVAGAAIAFSAASALLLQRRDRDASRFSDVFAAALLSLGVLDALHGAQHAGDAFVWLRSFGTALGGACFALVWMPARALRRLSWLPWLALVAACALGAFTLRSGELPQGFVGGRFNAGVVALNVGGGLAYLAAAARLAFERAERRDRIELLFAGQCALFGIAGVLFNSSTLWDPTWWTWHVLRLAAFAIAFASVVASMHASQARARLSEERFRSLLTLAPAGIAVLDRDGRFTLVNETCQRLFDRSEDELLGLRSAAVLEHGIDAHARESRTSTLALRRGGGSSAVDVRTRRIAGPREPMTLAVITDVSEVTCQRSALATRDAELVGAQADAQRSTALFQIAFESAPNGMLLVDANGVIVMANRHVGELFGYAEGELAGRDVGLLVPPASGARHRDLVARYFDEPGSRVTKAGRELSGVRKDGTEIPVEIGLNPVATAQGAHVLASVVDIAERVRQRESLAAKHRELELAAQLNERAAVRVSAVFEAATCGMLLVDRLGYVVMANAVAARMFGYAREELLGRPVDALVPTTLRQEHARLRADFHSAPIPRAMGSGRELHGLRKDGRELPIEIGLSPVATEEGVHVLASIVDVSERAAHVRVLQRRTDELARSNADLNDFAYAASHDLRAPLRAIGNLATWIEEDASAALPPESRRHLEMLRGRIQRMDRLLSDLLEYSRAGRAGAPPIDLDVARLVDEVVELLSPPPGFVVEADPSLPHVVASRAPFEQVLRNLIANAIKHHDKGSGRVRVSARELDEAVEFTVADDGPGIPLEFHERAFRMFQTLRPRDEVEGSGLGLALVRKTVISNHGEVHIEPREGRGTSVVFTWPKRPEVDGGWS